MLGTLGGWVGSVCVGVCLVSSDMKWGLGGSAPLVWVIVGGVRCLWWLVDWGVVGHATFHSGAISVGVFCVGVEWVASWRSVVCRGR